MNVSLTPELEDAVRRRVASGYYNNASEVIRQALRESFQREEENQWIVREVAIGYAQLKSGNIRKVTNRSEFEALLRSEG